MLGRLQDETEEDLRRVISACGSQQPKANNNKDALFSVYTTQDTLSVSIAQVDERGHLLIYTQTQAMPKHTHSHTRYYVSSTADSMQMARARTRFTLMRGGLLMMHKATGWIVETSERAHTVYRKKTRTVGRQHDGRKRMQTRSDRHDERIENAE